MSIKKALSLGCVIASISFAGPAIAGWKLVGAGAERAVGAVKVAPTTDWNQASAQPGKQGYSWTHDGFNLNRLEIFAGVPAGQSIYKERNKKQNPMPKFDRTMLLPDLADFFERSFRVQNQVSDFTIEHSAPVMLLGQRGIAVQYRYTLPNDDLVRRGEVRMATVDNKLYAVDFQAPALHYFDAGLPEAQAIMDAAHF